MPAHLAPLPLLVVIFGYAANFYVSNLKAAVVGPQGNTRHSRL
jgi:hypothetical protein